MVVFKKIFIVDTTDRPWYRIILWWELRRILYNFYLVIFGWLSLRLIAAMWNEGYIQLFLGPALVLGFYLSIIIFFIGANAFYTTGWIFQLLTKHLKGELIVRHTDRLFIYGLIISLFIIFSPVLLVILNNGFT